MNWALGKSNSMSERTDRSFVITSVFSWFSFKPESGSWSFLGVALCNPHLCHHFGAAVDHFGLHGLSCRFSTGCHYWNAALNDIIHRALSTSHIPSKLEPTGLDRSDGKRPMASRWFHGKAVTFWFGMPHVLTWRNPL